MYLGKYEYEGEREQLLAAYDLLVSGIPPESIGFHICITTDRGITVFDTCPTAEIFAETSSDPDFRAAMREAGLPEPTVTPLGPVHAARAPAIG